YVPPLRRAAQSADHLLKGIGVFGRVLEPSQEVEGLSKFSAVMQTSRYGRQVFHTNSNVPRLLLEDGSAFILRQVPPSCCLPDRNERRARRLRSQQHLLLNAQGLEFFSVCIARIARCASQNPAAFRRPLRLWPFNHRCAVFAGWYPWAFEAPLTASKS